MITSHKDLSNHIVGKRILHLNSLGKDAAVCLHWLNTIAHPSKIISLYFRYFSHTKIDEKYLNYQKKKYSETEFLVRDNASDLTNILNHYQSPIRILKEFNKLEYNDFSLIKCATDIQDEYNCDFMCLGHSKYESITRASNFHKNGILIDDNIYPIGLMNKAEIKAIIKGQKIKLHPYYKLIPSSPDYPSFYKMRSLILAYPEFKEKILKLYPLLELDKYRWERLLR